MRPTDQQVRRFLARAMITRVLVRTPDGRPFITPYWFVADGHRICITTGSRALLARYVDADPRVLLLFEADRDRAPAPLLRITGTARVRHGRPPLPLLVRSVLKYLVSPGGLRHELAHLHLLGLRRRYYAHAAPAWIEVTPETAAFE